MQLPGDPLRFAVCWQQQSRRRPFTSRLALSVQAHMMRPIGTVRWSILAAAEGGQGWRVKCPHQGVPEEIPLELWVVCLQQQRGARAAAGQGTGARAPSPRREVGGSRPGSPGRGAGPMLSPRERAFSPKRADGEHWAALHWDRRLQAGSRRGWRLPGVGKRTSTPMLLP